VILNELLFFCILISDSILTCFDRLETEHAQRK
jgi:hypothetical protein